MAKKKQQRFHTPFHALREQLREVPSRSPAPTPAPAALKRPTSEETTPQDMALFLAEMAGVKPLPADSRGRVERQRRLQRHAPIPAAEAEALADLRNVVDGHGAFTLQYTDEYMEGVAPGVDRRLAQRLHRGDYAVQAHLDLHGYTVEEAHAVVEHFLTTAYMQGKRCVLLIHGRGHNSRDHRPVLKEQVRVWLSRGRLSRLVLAFATAPPGNGGAGAVCVLLRRLRRYRAK